MYSEPSFFEVRQAYANESLPVLKADTARIYTAEMIPYDQMNRDIQLEASAGGNQSEPVWQNPAASGSYW
jgi:hypothetical protein